MTNNKQDLYKEYADMMAAENGDYYNTEEFGKKLANSPVFKIIDKLEGYEEKLLNRALKELKTKKEWQDLEADDIRVKATGIMNQMSAFELLERYKDKIQRSYKSEAWFKTRLDECDKVIEATRAWRHDTKKKANILKHWRSERVRFDLGYWRAIRKSNRYERLINKWSSICYQIELADIAKEIESEKRGIGNKYGFNPTMQSRATAIDVFVDNEA